MHFEPHATLGWTIGILGSSDLRVRRYVTLAAVLPDLDAVSYLGGPAAYGHWHHTFGHNLLLWGLCTAFVFFRLGSARAGFLVALSFGSHLLTDACLSGWPLYLFWPFSRSGFLFPGAVGLSHPINDYLVYGSFPVLAILTVLYKRSPIELISPAFDRLLMSAFTPRTLECSCCGRRTNQKCGSCEAPLCWTHSIVTRAFAVRCARCDGA